MTWTDTDSDEYVLKMYSKLIRLNNFHFELMFVILIFATLKIIQPFDCVFPPVIPWFSALKFHNRATQFERVSSIQWSIIDFLLIWKCIFKKYILKIHCCDVLRWNESNGTIPNALLRIFPCTFWYQRAVFFSSMNFSAYIRSLLHSELLDEKTIDKHYNLNIFDIL